MWVSSGKGFTKPFSLVSIFSWIVGYGIGHCSPILWILWFITAKNLSSGLYLLLLYFLKLLQNQPLYLSLSCLHVCVCFINSLIQLQTFHNEEKEIQKWSKQVLLYLWQGNRSTFKNYSVCKMMLPCLFWNPNWRPR